MPVKLKNMNWWLLVGGILISLSRLLIGNNKGFSGPGLIIADEALAFGAFLFLFGLANYLLKTQRTMDKRSVIVIIASLLAMVAWVQVILSLGRMIYPVNGLALAKEMLLVYLSEVYGALHFADLNIAVLTIALSFKQSKLTKYGGLLVGVLQIVGSYFAGPVMPLLTNFSILTWLLWLVAFSAYSND